MNIQGDGKTGRKKSYLDFQIEQMTPEEAKKVSEKIDNKLFGETTVEASKSELVTVGEFADEAKELVNNWGKLQGISTGIKGVDYNMRGLVGGELIVLAGETSNGKTALGVQIATNVALAGHTVLFVTLEITQAQLTARIAKIVNNNEEVLTKLPILMQKEDELDWRDVDALIANAKDNGAELVVIDHLHYFTREITNMAEDLGRITKQFKKNAIRHKLPVILISHVRKKDNSNKPEMSNDALRGSSYIAQDADVVCFVHKSDADHLLVKVTKNRNRGYDFEHDTQELEFIDGAKIQDMSIVRFHDPFGDLK
jgi:replicative DNA helicase